MTEYDFPHGFILSEAALYAFKCQDVFGDIVSFAAAIPDHLKPLFLIPIKVETIAASAVAAKIASKRYADGMLPDGDTEEADWFGTKTFVNDDDTPTIPSSEPGSIFDIDGADNQTHHQEYFFDENIQVPTDTTYIEDVDITQYWDYPYRTKEQPVRHSSERMPIVVVANLALVRTALKPEQLEPRTPKKIQDNASSCSVSLISYDKQSRVFTFSVDCGNGAKTVQASLSEIDQVALSCNCKFWRYNGPEFHAKENQFILGQPFGTASPPNVRDPDRKYWLCKHAYAVLRRLDNFVEEITEENWELNDQELLKQVDAEWDRLEGAVQIPAEELEDTDVEIDTDWEDEFEEDLPEPEPEVEEETDELADLLEPEPEEEAEEAEEAEDFEIPSEEIEEEIELEEPEESESESEEEPEPEPEEEAEEEPESEDYEESEEQEPQE